MKKRTAYLGLFFVVFVWGLTPQITLELYKFYSPSARLVFSGLVLLVAYLLMSRKHLKEFDFTYLKIGIPTGLFMALANLSQKIGLLYTTPARYAFLENLSCISVPILMFFLVKKKPTFMTVLSALTCLLSVFILSGLSFSEGLSLGIGEILCGAAGLLYGFNIAGTGAFAKKLHAPLYLAVQQVAGLIVYIAATLILDKVTYAGAPIEPIKFSWEPMHMLYVVAIALISSALCWTIRTNAMKHVDASAVAIIMPFSAVVSSVISILAGTDKLSFNLVIGGLLGLLAIFMSSFEDIFKKRA